MADVTLVDPLEEARARAQLSLRADAWSSFKLATGAFLAVAGLTGTLMGVAVSNEIVSGRTFPWIVFSLSVAGAILAYLVLEVRRLYEKAVALNDLFRTVIQYDVLLRDARNERDQLQRDIRNLGAEVLALKTLLSLTEATRSPSPREASDARPE